mgnify:FL=1
MKSQRKPYLSTTQIILLSFLGVILIGSVLLSLPVSSAGGRAVPYIDALFTATTATCVTGLVTVSTAATWSVFGQAVILLLIQIGGLGVITFMTAVMLLFNRKIGISDRLLIQDAFNLSTLSGIVAFVKKVLIGTLTVESIGACFYMTVFVPQFGARGIWVSVFNSVSAFCNAGMDIIGENSLCDYSGNALITLTTAALIILGGLGYIVWWDVSRVIKNRKQNGGRFFKSLTLHSKIVFISTAFLLITGTALTLCFEYNNPLTLEGLPLSDKIQAAFFQSVTTRTAGFASLPQENLKNPTAILSLLLMFIGGSPVGTAGGIKTVTAAVLLSITVSLISGKNSVSLFGRTISKQSVYKAVAVTVMSFSVMFVSTLLLSAVTNAPALDILFETVSATATVGLSRSLTGALNLLGKLIIIFTMYFGRVGPISIAIAFGGKNPSRNIIKNPTEEISIG